jgi:hypothetical protein
MKRNLTEVFGNYDKLKQGAHYTVALAERAKPHGGLGSDI